MTPASECIHAELARAAGAAMNAADRWNFGPAETLFVLCARVLSGAEPQCPLAVVRTETGGDVMLSLGSGFALVRFSGEPFAGIVGRVGPGCDFAASDQLRRDRGLVENGEEAVRARLAKAVERAVGETCQRGMSLEQSVLSVLVRALNEVSQGPVIARRATESSKTANCETAISITALNSQHVRGEIVLVADEPWLAAARSLFPGRADLAGDAPPAERATLH